MLWVVRSSQLIEELCMRRYRMSCERFLVLQHVCSAGSCKCLYSCLFNSGDLFFFAFSLREMKFGDHFWNSAQAGRPSAFEFTSDDLILIYEKSK